jgi:hypothetical protein
MKDEKPEYSFSVLNSKFSLLLWIFVILFIVLGLGYSILTPIFENSDETLHYPYVKHLADGRGLPIAIPGQLWHQEGTQPPLYYAIVAASTFWIDSNNLLDHLQPNPHWRFTEVRSVINDNQNAVLHGPMDAFPYRRAALAIHIGRWWSLFFGLITVACTFLIARHLFPNNLPLTISATALTALTPQFIRVSATVSNDSLSAALASFTVLVALKFTEPPLSRVAGEGRFANTSFFATIGRFTFRGIGKEINSPLLPRPLAPLHYHYAFLLGLLAGLALLTKLSSLSVFFLVVFIVFWRLFFTSELHQHPIQNMIRWLLIIAGITAVLNGWWFFRNQRLYGEWLAIETHLNLAGRGHLTLSEIWGLRAEAERAYWATLGWGQIRPPEWVYQLLGWFTRLGLIGLGLAGLVKLAQGTRSKPIPLNLRTISYEKIIFLAFWAGLNLALYGRWVMAVGSVSHTRLIFPAITAISLLLALGWHAWLPRPLESWFAGLLAAGLLTLNIYNLGWLIYPAFNPDGQHVNVAKLDSSVDLIFLDSLHLVAGGVKTYAPTSSRSATLGDVITIDTQWQAVAAIDKNYSVAAVLLAPDGSVLARRETYPGLGLRPTRYLKPGDTFIDSYPLKLTGQVSEPVVARAVINLFDFDSTSRAGFPALDAQGNEVTAIAGQIKIIPKTWPEYEPTYSTSVSFARAISLVGYDLAEVKAKAEAKAEAEKIEGSANSTNLANSPTYQLTLYWKSLAPVDEDYNLFIHLLDREGNVVAQADAPPTNNAYPTSWWASGEIIADVRSLPVAPEATRLRLGLYSLSSGRRLPITESTLPGRDSSVEIELP